MIKAKGKVKREKQEAQKELEDSVEIPVKKAERDTGHYGANAVPTKEIVQVWGDEIEEIFKDLNSTINRPSAEDKALNVLRHLRLHVGVKFSER